MKGKRLAAELELISFPAERARSKLPILNPVTFVLIVFYAYGAKAYTARQGEEVCVTIHGHGQMPCFGPLP